MKIYIGLIGKSNRECGHEHKTKAAALRCALKQIGAADKRAGFKWTVK